MGYTVQLMAQYGIRPSEWDWYRRFGQVRIEPTPEYRSAVRRIWLSTSILVGLDVAIMIGLMVMSVQIAAKASQLPAMAGSFVVPIGLAVLIRILNGAGTNTAAARSRAVRQQRAPRIFGTPGQIREAAARFGQGPAEAGARGEESTAALLELLLCIPGTMVFHGLQFPGNVDADVDHAVVLGNVVFLIDSKLYRWGSYEWRSAGFRDLIVRSDGYGRGTANWMHTAAERYQAMLGDHVAVIPLVMIHGRNTSVGPERASAHGVHMLTARDAMESLGNTLAHGAGESANVAAVRLMVSMLKTAASPAASPPARDGIAPLDPR
ncbi:nuclease-related domain-containing protein [Sinomonas albida]|uniref:nuclease-related domain-containing protein n=1 Tax=Sinomonas albida TaxID=369942 RepID=UPI0010A9385E|nr:nuclease-related domain-containing protein [Sinomonas albida]